MIGIVRTWQRIMRRAGSFLRTTQLLRRSIALILGLLMVLVGVLVVVDLIGLVPSASEKALFFELIDNVGIVGVVIGVIIGGYFLGYGTGLIKHDRPLGSTIPPEPEASDPFAEVVKSVADEIIPISSLDVLSHMRDNPGHKAWKNRMEVTRAMCSSDPVLAKMAVEASRSNGWLNDGSLRKLNVPKANLADVDLSKAVLSGACFRLGNLTGANLKWADLQGADLEGANLVNASLVGTDFREARLARTQLKGADMRLAKLKGAKLFEANLGSANLTDANFAVSDLLDVAFDKADLTKANFQGARNVDMARLAQAHKLRGATMPDGSRYDGHLSLSGDIDAARASHVDIEDAEAMAAYYGVPLQKYRRGQEKTMSKTARNG